MAYDEQLAERIRAELGGEQAVAERKMFGGLAFLVAGNMAVAASGQGGLLVRVDPAETDELLEDPAVEPMVMQGRPMRGWLRVDGALVEDDASLREWVDRGTAFARSLPAKG